MKRLAGLAPALVILVAALAFVDAPLWRGLPLGDDTELHLYRLVDLDYLLRLGIVYSRWQPDLAYGYGSPLFSFYSPLSAYVAELGHLLGLSLRDGLRATFAALPVVAAGATYHFLRRRLAQGPALLGAIAYPTSLYFLYNLYVRGSVSDALAIALFPVVLLAFDRLAELPKPLRAATAALAYAAALLSHDITGPMLLPLIVLCLLWWGRGRPGALRWPAAAIGLGIGLSLFVLGPAVADEGATRVPAWLATPGMRYDQYFASPAGLLVPVAVARPGAMLTGLPTAIGLPQLALGLAALLGLGRLKPRARGEVVIFAASLLVTAILAVPWSDPIWSRLRLLQIINYPWRLLAIGAFADALLIAYLAQELLVGRPILVRSIALGAGAALVLVLAVPYLYPRPGTSLVANPGFADLTAFQQRTGALGSTSDAEFLPAGLTDLPQGPPFPGADRGAPLGQKLDPSSLPAGASARVQADGPLAARLEVTTPTAFVARFDVFRFPGWSASIDGNPVPFAAPGPFQTLTVPIPAGQHVLALEFGETRTRLAFDLASVFSAGIVLGLAVVGLRERAGLPSPPAPSPTRAGEGPPALALLLVVLVVAGFRPLVFSRGLTRLVRPFDGQHPPGMAVAAPHRFGASLELLGYTWDRQPAVPGQADALTLYWKTDAPLATNYSSFVHLLDSSGRGVVGADNVHVADYPTSWWRVGAYAPDVHRITVPAGAPAGSYRVEIGLYDRATGRQLPVDGGPADTLALPALTISGGR